MALNQLVNFPVQTNFRFWCPELPLLSELAQDITIPAVTLNPTETYHRDGDYSQPGEKLLFTELDIGFAMDEYFDVYAEVYSWMNLMAGWELTSKGIVEATRKVLFCDCEVIALDNNQKASRKFIFHDSWPTQLGALPFDQAGDPANIKGIVTFQYIAMSITPDTKNLTQLGELRYNH